MPDAYQILLVESDDYVMGLMQKNIRGYLPHAELSSASTPDAAMDLLQHNNYDVVICDAFLMRDKRISFVRDMCDKAAFFLIVITGDTDVTAESFSAHFNESCIHHVLYKPLELQEFLKTLQCAILRVKARRKEPSGTSRERG